jgi:hypothetical protein
MWHRPTEIAPDGIFILEDGRVKECNHFLAAQAGYGMDEVEGTCFASFFDRDSIPTVEALCGQMPPQHRLGSISGAVLLCKNGTRLRVRLRADYCRFNWKPAVMVTLTVLEGHAPDWTSGAEMDSFLIPEESLAAQPACS